MIRISSLLLCLIQVSAVRNLQIASPLQALTIWDPQVKDQVSTTPRKRFLAKFRAGLQAEARARKEIAAKQSQQLQLEAQTKNWAQRAAAADQQIRASEEARLEQAFDRAVAQVEEHQVPQSKAISAKNPNQYQFVGVVNPSSNETPITWYARKKPADAKWSVRLIHANRRAILKDLHNRGKVDIFAKYENTGQTSEESNIPVVQSQYNVRERSWK